MQRREHSYTTFIRTTPEKLWLAITTPEFTKQYWAGHVNISEWRKGAKWQHMSAGGDKEVFVEGEILECTPPKRLILTWVDPDDQNDISRVSFDIDFTDGVVCLRVVHDSFADGSTMPDKVSQGWPRVLSSLKSYLETGEPLDIWKHKKCGSQACAAQ